MKSLAEAAQAIQQINIVRHTIIDDGQFPNNALFPLIVLQKAIPSPNARLLEEIFESNRWVSSWRNGIYDYHHYHSTAHEVLGVTRGTGRVQFGGPSGITIPLEAGDVVIIPAGVAHKRIESEDDFEVVGAYPEGQQYDIKKGDKDDRPKADENIKRVPLPQSDPVYGIDGPLIKNWSTSPNASQ